MKEKIDVQKPDDLGLDISDLRYFLVMLLFSAVVFFLLISQRLTNTFDGLWNNTWFFGGYWQVVTGRWLWPVIDALRFGIQTEPFNSLLTLSMSALAVTLLRKFFTEKDSVVTYLAGMAVLASTVGFSRRCLAAHFCFLFWRQSVWFVPQILEKRSYREHCFWS